MEILGSKRGAIQAVKIVFSTLIILTVTGCATKKTNDNYINNYQIITHKTKTGNTYLDLQSFEFENKSRKFPATYQINNLIFPPESKNHKNRIFKILPGNFSINAGGVSKKWTNLKNLNLKKGDSAVVRIFLKDDPEPLY